MSPTIGENQGCQATTFTSTTLTVSNALNVPVSDDILPYDGSSSSAQAVSNNVLDTRTVRRRTSPEDIALRSSQPDSPQKAALRNELAGKDESITLLRQQLLGVQNVAMSELQAQRNSFGGMAIMYEREASGGVTRDYAAEIFRLRHLEQESHDKHEAQILLSQNQLLHQMSDKARLQDLMHEEQFLRAEIQFEADAQLRFSTEENQSLALQNRYLQSQLDSNT